MSSQCLFYNGEFDAAVVWNRERLPGMKSLDVVVHQPEDNLPFTEERIEAGHLTGAPPSMAALVSRPFRIGDQAFKKRRAR
jgi:hypothetical protein